MLNSWQISEICSCSYFTAKTEEKIEKEDAKIQDSYQEIRELYEKSNNRILELIYQDKAEGFETIAWFLMLSEETQKRLR